MTYLEKYKLENPGLSDEEYRTVVTRNCPIDNNGRALRCPPPSMVRPGISNACPVCWNQEIPGTENNEREDGNMSKNFTKKDLKVGYVVKCKNANLYMVMFDNNGELGFSRLHGQMTMDCYDNDLRCVPAGHEDFDIVEVYDRSKLYYATSISTEHRDLLWKREPEKTCDSCAHKVVCTHVGMCEHYMEKAK